MGHNPAVSATVTDFKSILGLKRLRSPWPWAVIPGMSMAKEAQEPQHGSES